MSPGPKPLHVSPIAVRWSETYEQDITTGAPQKLFRHLVDAVRGIGLIVIHAQEPRIVGQAIGDTGTAEGELMCESDLVEVGSPIIRLVGLGFLVFGIGILLWALAMGTSGFGQLIFGLVILFIGVVLLRSHTFRSHLVYISVKGEAYRSGLAAGTRMPTEVADTQRLSVVSELRLSLYGATIESKNAGESRVYNKSVSSEQMTGYFQVLVDNVTQSVLPKVLLQKTWEQTRHEYGYAAPATVREVTHEILVRCGYCNTINPDTEPACQNCGARLR